MYEKMTRVLKNQLHFSKCIQSNESKEFVLSGLVRISSYLKLIRPTMHAAVKHGTPRLTSLPKDGEVSCKGRSPRSPIRSLTSFDQA